ncbi:MAG: CPBP family intramembrane metalloprotease [Clostridia bacterium]|nr:CPBP family intramembrane metalloprotease [Clostridia bacterium]
MKDKTNLLAGFLPVFTVLILFLAKQLIANGFIEQTWQMVALIQTVAFIIPTVTACLIGRKLGKKVALPSRPINLRQFWFTLIGGIAVAFLAFWANFTVINNTGIAAVSGKISVENIPWYAVFIINAFIPAIAEELLFRGAMHSLLSEFGTSVSIVTTAICFSIIHMDISNIAGSFIFGLFCGYLTYSFTSLIPAFFVHLICNSCYLVMDFFIDTYEIFGLVPYFFVTNVFLFLLFGYFAFTSLEKLIEKGKVQKFKRSKPGNYIMTTLGSPGVVVMLLITIMSIAYNV